MQLSLLGLNIKFGYMKSQSLLSQRSNLSQLSNVSYRGEKKEYTGAEFFRESLPPGHHQKLANRELKHEQVQLDSLGIGVFKNFATLKDCASAFTPFWTSELPQSIEGTSDNENEPELPIVKKQEEVKKEVQPQIQEDGSSYEQPPSLSDKMPPSEIFSVSERAVKNETKNIPKNYGKAIIIFIESNRSLIEDVLSRNGDDYDHLLSKLRNLKKKINTISDLRNLWENQPESKSLRTISNTFLRKHSLHYIYNSRIKTRLCHAKYKRRLQQAILNPQDFNHIKDY